MSFEIGFVCVCFVAYNTLVPQITLNVRLKNSVVIHDNIQLITPKTRFVDKDCLINKLKLPLNLK